MHWILIIMMGTGYTNGGVAIDHVQFADQASCQNAASAALAAAHGAGRADLAVNGHGMEGGMDVRAFCVADASAK